jgi:Fe2+ transport system protein FeoA
MATFVACPMCGFDFDRDDTLCSHGCPLGPMCRLIRCPSCDYEFSEIPRRYSWIARLLGRKPDEPSRLPPDVRPVTTLEPGSRAEVLCIGGQQGPRPNALAVFGLVPETEITIVQLRPACVIRVGQTELALDREIAEEILVRETTDG